MKRFIIASMLVILAAACSGQPLRITCVGNSITEGSGVGNPTYDAYPVQVGSMFGEGYEVKNSGVSGRTMLKHGDYPIWNETKFADGISILPNFVTILLGTNDSKPYNWIYKDEYIPDYLAMIDTFAALPTHPQIFLGYPPPAFSGAFDIRDSIITADIIPMIAQVSADRGSLPIIDFYNQMTGMSAAFPDGIHPNIEGHVAMAKIVYEAISGSTIGRFEDVDLAEAKPVQASGYLGKGFSPENLNDHDRATLWKAAGLPAWIVLDLGSKYFIDMFQTDFSDFAVNLYSYTIDVSVDSVNWIQLIYRPPLVADNPRITIDRKDSTEARYVRLTVVNSSAGNDTACIADFRVLQANGCIHAPILLPRLNKVMKTGHYYEIDIIPSSETNEAPILFRKKPAEVEFIPITGFRPNSYRLIKELVKTDETNLYYCGAFHEGKEVYGDTISISALTTGVSGKPGSVQPESFELQGNFPNPFNPGTYLVFRIPQSGEAAIEVFDMLGRKIRSIEPQIYPAGTHRVYWNGSDDAGNPMPSGVYAVAVKSGGVQRFRKILLVR
ncbi:discoidin domain-containing protein [bacterium]|nr:discoidin domain-containing protein [bacterium]